MVDSLKNNFPAVLLQSNYSESSQGSAGTSSKKITKPEDLVRIYDIMLQVRNISTLILDQFFMLRIREYAKTFWNHCQSCVVTVVPNLFLEFNRH